MATIVSETNLVTKGECQKTQNFMSNEFNSIKDILAKLPKQIFDEANDIYVRKDVYDINIRSMVDEMKRISENTEDLQKNDSDRLFKIIQMAVSVITVLGMAYLATK
jgi:ERCC4-related helicase